MTIQIRSLLFLLIAWTSASAQNTELFLHSELYRTTGHLLSRVTLKGTKLLNLPDDLFDRQWQQLERYFLRRLNETPAQRDVLWKAG